MKTDGLKMLMDFKPVVLKILDETLSFLSYLLMRLVAMRNKHHILYLIIYILAFTLILVNGFKVLYIGIDFF